MTAQVRIMRWTGPAISPVIDDVTNLNSRIDCLDGQTTGDTTSPVYTPFASLWACFRLRTLVAPFAHVNNFRFFVEDTFDLGTGITVAFGEATAYKQATPGVFTGSGTVLNLGNYPSLVDQGGGIYTSNLADWTEATPYFLTSTMSGVGDFGNWLVLQVLAGSGASSSSSARGRVKFTYDEV